MTITRTAYGEQVHRHVHDFFAGHESRSHGFERGPIQSVLPGFHVIEVDPGPKLGLSTYVSVGPGFPDESGHRHLEFLATAEQPSMRHVELLAMASHYHRTGERLDIGHTFPIGEPWLHDSTLDHMLVSLPYPFGPDLEIFAADKHEVHILWLLPITLAERDYKRQHGLDELEARFEEAELKYWKPMRESVV